MRGKRVLCRGPGSPPAVLLGLKHTPTLATQNLGRSELKNFGNVYYGLTCDKRHEAVSTNELCIWH